MSVMDQAPGELTQDQASELSAASKDAARELRQPQSTDDVDPVEVIAEGSADPTAEVKITDRDLDDLNAIQPVPESDATTIKDIVDVDKAKQSGEPNPLPHMVAQETARQAREVIQQTAPGSPEELQAYKAMQNARRAGSMNVDGLTTPAAESTAPADVAPTDETSADDQDAVVNPDATEKPAVKKKHWWSRSPK